MCVLEIGKGAKQCILTQCDQLQNYLWRCVLQFTQRSKASETRTSLYGCTAVSGATEAGGRPTNFCILLVFLRDEV